MDVEQTAFVLHTRPYRETSAIVTFLTPEHGKLNAVVRGVKGSSKSSSMKAAAIQPFQQVLIRWKEKAYRQSDLNSLSQCEPLMVRFPLMGEANICGLYLNELLYRLLYPNIAVDRLYGEYQQALYALASAKERSKQAWTLRLFETQLLDELGHGLILNHDMAQNDILADQQYLYYPEMGAQIWQGEPVDNSGIKISGKALISLSEGELNIACLAEQKQLLRQVLAIHLGPRPIKARELFV
jgi:DNA repair protein RecO (recombination protein O)